MYIKYNFSILYINIYNFNIFFIGPEGFWRKGNVDIVCEKY